MKKLVTMVILVLGTMVLAVPAAEADAHRVTLKASAAHRPGQAVVISGKVKGAVRSVRIEQRKAGRWVLMRKAAVRKGAYRVKVKPVATTTVRAVSGSAASKAVTVTTVPVATKSDACGTVLKKADGSTWTCTFHDEFDGTSLDRSVWTPQTQFAMGTQAAHTCYVDDPSTVNVSGGSLNLSIRKVATPATCTFGALSGPTNYVSGGVMSYRTISQQYGRFEARVKNTATSFPGLHEAFWLWPDDRVASNTVWPFAGEIDISETYSSHPTLSIPFLHYKMDAYGNLPGLNTAWNCAAARGVWNTYALEWTPSQLQIFVNGRSCLVNKSGDSAFQKAYIMAFTQGLGAAGNVYDGRAPLGTLNVDYVRVWK